MSSGSNSRCGTRSALATASRTVGSASASVIAAATAPDGLVTATVSLVGALVDEF
jgi:hypothetical protein